MAALSASRLVCSEMLWITSITLPICSDWDLSRATTVAAFSRLPVMRPLAWMLSANSASPCSTRRLASRASSSARAALWLTLSAVLASSVTAEATCSVSLRCCWALASDWVMTAASSVAAEATLPLMPVRV
ncbi:hypothetical protein D3C79_525580 [compost metagenome]